MLGRRVTLLLLATAFWSGTPAAFLWPGGDGSAAWAKQGGSGSGSGSSGGGSGNSGSGSGSSNDDDDDGGDDDHSGHGSSGSGNSGQGDGDTGGTAVSRNWLPKLDGDGIHVQFFDGHIERIRSGHFERIDKSGRLIERRAATAGEVQRLRSLEAELEARGRASGIVTIAEIDESSGRVEITDFRGWRETLSAARYQLRDPNGRTVSRRALTPEDIVRVRSLLFLN